jgi:hypothetical protein
MALLQAQKANRIKVMDEAAKPTKDFKLKKFRDVESRIDQKHSRVNQNDRRSSKQFLQKGAGINVSKIERAPAVANDGYRTRQAAAKPRVPRAAAAEPLVERKQKNFIRENNVAAAQHLRRRKSSAEEDQRQVSTHSRGEVPDYLHKRKQEVAEEKRRQAQVDSDCPPGMVLMPDADRRETLSTLKQSKREAEDQLMKMPLNIHTMAQKKRQESLEAQLKEIENAITIFNKPKVYIADD